MLYGQEVVMKIIATVTDCGAVVHAGGSAESRSAIIDLGENLPPVLQEYLDNLKWAKEGPNRYTYKNLTFSILDDTV